jgi:hypothetical protein
MPSKVTTTPDLLALFTAKATAPPPESSQILVRHLQCKESVRAAQSLTEALDRYAADHSQPLAAPTELLPPLG